MNAATDLEVRFLEFVHTGDAGPLGEVFDATVDDLYRLALHLCGAPSTAEDVVQAAWLKAIEGADTYTPGRPVKAWLTGILQNEVRMYYRRENVRQRPLDRDAAPAIDPAQEVERRELTELLDAGIAKLPEPYGPVVRLHLRHGLNANAIGEALDRPAGTVRTQLVRGLDRLRKLLPASLAGVAAALAVPTRGKAAVRQSVMEGAGPVAAGAATAGAGGLGVLGLRRLLVVSAVLLAATTAVLLWDPAGGAPGDAAPTETRVADADAGDSPVRPVADRAAVVPSRSETGGSAPGQPGAAAEPGTEPMLQLRGQVTGPGDVRIADAEVFVFRRRARVEPDGSFASEPLVAGRSDAEGRFGLSFPRGAFELFARAEGFAQSEAVRGTGDPTLDHYDSARIVMAPAVAVRGRLLGAEGRPIAGQQVDFVHTYGTSAGLREDHPSVLRSGAGSYRVVTGDDGGFTVRGPAGVKFWTTVRHADHLDYGLSHEFRASGFLLVQLERGDEIAGRVFLADGRPAAGAMLRLDAETYRSTVADDGGRFVIRGVQLGERGYLSVRHEDAAVFCLAPIPEQHRALTLRLAAPCTLAGQVVDEAGTPVAGAELRVVGARRVEPEARHLEPTTWEWAQGVANLRSDAEGRFAFTRLNQGRYTLQVARSSLAEGMLELDVVAGRQDLTVRLVEAATRKAVLTGAVVRVDDGEPVAAAELKVYPAAGGRNRLDTTDAEGRYEMVGFEPGDYVVQAGAAGFARRSSVVRLRLGDNPHPVRLARAVDVRVRLRRADGEVLTGALVGLRDATGEDLSFQVGQMGVSRLPVDEDGIARLQGAPAESVELVVDAFDEDVVVQSLDLTGARDGEVLDVVVAAATPWVRLLLLVATADAGVPTPDPLAPGGRERLRELIRSGALGAPQRGATVTLRSSDGRELSRGEATHRPWSELPDAARWQEAKAAGLQPFTIQCRWSSGSIEEDPRPMAVLGFELRGRPEAMILRVEAPGHDPVETPIDGAQLPSFDASSAPPRPRLVLLRR